MCVLMGWGLGEEKCFPASPGRAPVALSLEESEIEEKLDVWARGKGTSRLGEKSPAQS